MTWQNRRRDGERWQRATAKCADMFGKTGGATDFIFRAGFLGIL